jgi:seryl-tRNA synthetase
MLNSTLCATERLLCAITENYQDKDGIRIPDVLLPFMHGAHLMSG